MINLNYKGVPLKVWYNHEPAEPESSDREYPGCPAETTIEQVLAGDIDIAPLLSDETIDELIKAVENTF